MTGIFWRRQSKLNNNITSALATAVAGRSCFKTEQMIKNDWHKISTHSQSLNKGELCNWKQGYVLFSLFGYINSEVSCRQYLKWLSFWFTVYWHLSPGHRLTLKLLWQYCCFIKHGQGTEVLGCDASINFLLYEMHTTATAPLCITIM